MGPGPDTGCACGGGLAVLIAGIALAGCGGSGATTTTTSAPVASSTAPTTTTKSSGAGSKPTSSGAAKGKAGGSAPSPGACAAAWNRTGPAPSLEHVLLPSLRASGPFPAQVGRAPGRCALIVHASGIEGTGRVTYEIAERPSGAFVQASVGDLGAVAPASLERNGSLRLSP